MAGMPKKSVPSTDELARMLWQAEAKAAAAERPITETPGRGSCW
jgi:hypothetical protein